MLLHSKSSTSTYSIVLIIAGLLLIALYTLGCGSGFGRTVSVYASSEKPTPSATPDNRRLATFSNESGCSFYAGFKLGDDNFTPICEGNIDPKQKSFTTLVPVDLIVDLHIYKNRKSFLNDPQSSEASFTFCISSE